MVDYELMVNDGSLIVVNDGYTMMVGISVDDGSIVVVR